MENIDYEGRSNCYTYMGWQLITSPSSLQYQLREDAGQNFDSEGFGIIDGRYVIACTTHYGGVGDYIDWKLADNTILHTVIGDIKSSSDSNWSEYGHIYGDSLCVVEFVVDYNTWYSGGQGAHDNPGTANCHPEWAGIIQGYDNIGNYWTGVNEITTNETFFIVKGTRFGLHGSWRVQYIGTKQGDNYIYFNDDKFWRCRPDKTGLQVFYINKEMWVNSSSITDLSLASFKITSASSGGTVATNSQVETAVQWLIDKATNEEITYSQSVRNLKNPSGSSYDCSSFVITGFYVAGLDANCSTTYDMKSAFEDLGFTWIEGSYFDSSDCLRGDILIKQFDPGGHTQVYIGNNQDVNCGSTPARVQEHAPDNYGRSWDGILRLM